jgi:2,3-bisphosphoglycerate-independent phosphoglycerate mutase
MAADRKIVYLVGDGMGDYALDALGGKTPLQAAAIPNMRAIAAAGTVRMIRTAPDGMFPGSDVCNLALFGYDPAENYTGRAPIEAAGAKIPLQPDDVTFRCNLVTVSDEVMRDHSAGHITSEEAMILIDSLRPEIERDGLRFHHGVSYRHLLVWDHGPADVETQLPHEILDQPTAGHLPRGERADEIKAIMDASREVFAGHPVNWARNAEGKNPATQIWLWGQGHSLTLESFATRYGRSGGVITAVDLLRGLAVLTELKVIDVEGATGWVDTNYEGKAQAALDCLREDSFVYVHVEAPDECGHQGNAKLKTEAIEMFDARIVGPIWRAMEERGEPYRLIVTMDHRTPCALRGHSDEPVPMAVLDGPVGPVTDQASFDESCNNGKAEVMAHDWVQELLRTPS